jgi:tetratricopeptide (TPR) repeat protein
MIRATWPWMALLVTAPCLSQSDEFEAALQSGIGRVQAQDFAGAIEPLEKAARLRPTSFQAGYILGVALAQTGRRLDAIRRLRVAREAYPQHTGALMLLGVLYTNEGYSLDAMEVLEQAIRLQASQIHVNLLLVQAYHDSFEFDKALRLAVEIADRFPSSADAHFRLGYELETSGRFEEARTSLERALKLKADHPEAHLALGRLDSRQGQRAEAANHFQAVLQVQPGHPVAMVELAKVFVAMRQFQSAKTLLVRFQDAGNPTVHLLLSQVYAGEGDSALSTKHRLRYMELATAQPGGMSGNVEVRKLRRFDPAAVK